MAPTDLNVVPYEVDQSILVIRKFFEDNGRGLHPIQEIRHVIESISRDIKKRHETEEYAKLFWKKQMRTHTDDGCGERQDGLLGCRVDADGKKSHYRTKGFEIQYKLLCVL